MKYINYILYLEFNELVEANIPVGTIYSHSFRKSTGWTFVSDPSDKRKVLIEYSSLKPQYKELITKKFGDPYIYLASTIIKQHLSISEDHRNFILNYIIPDGNKLPLAKQAEYITACSYLNFLSNVKCHTWRNLGFTKSKDFYSAVIKLIETDKAGLPTSYPKLLAKAKAFKTHGPSVVISKKFCNDNSKKVKDEISSAVLLEMIAHHNQFEDVYVARKYNEWAKIAGYKSITDVTVGNYRRKNLLYVTHSRDGMKPWQDQFGKSIQRERPSYALALINGDDNILDLAFRIEKKNFERVTLYVIIDAYNDYPLGYSIEHRTASSGIKAAFLNAVHHIHELTGEYLLWHQLQTDRWGIGVKKNKETELARFLQMQDADNEPQVIFTPAQAGNARSKPIEQSFGKNWHSKLRVYENYTGFNITAKTKRNWEALSKRSKDFPELEHAYKQVASFIHEVRTAVNPRTGISKQQKWLEGYSKIPADRKRILTDETRLLHFGFPHTHTNKITNAGLNITLNGEIIGYDIAQAEYIKHIGRTMQVFYDPYDLTKVLAVNEDRRIQVLCPVREKMKMAVIEMTEGDRAKLNVKLKEQKAIGQHMLDAKASREDVLTNSRIDVHSMLMLPSVPKEVKQLSEESFLNQQLEPSYTAPMPIEEEEDLSGLDVFDLQLRLQQNKAI